MMQDMIGVQLTHEEKIEVLEMRQEDGAAYHLQSVREEREKVSHAAGQAVGAQPGAAERLDPD